MTPEQKKRHDNLIAREARDYSRFKPDSKHAGLIDIKNQQIALAREVARCRLVEIEELNQQIKTLEGTK